MKDEVDTTGTGRVRSWNTRVRGGGGVEIHGYVVGMEFFLALFTGTGRVWSFSFCTVVVAGMNFLPVQTNYNIEL